MDCCATWFSQSDRQEGVAGTRTMYECSPVAFLLSPIFHFGGLFFYKKYLSPGVFFVNIFFIQCYRRLVVYYEQPERKDTLCKMYCFNWQRGRRELRKLSHTNGKSKWSSFVTFICKHFSVCLVYCCSFNSVPLPLLLLMAHHSDVLNKEDAVRCQLLCLEIPSGTSCIESSWIRDGLVYLSDMSQ